MKQKNTMILNMKSFVMKLELKIIIFQVKKLVEIPNTLSKNIIYNIIAKSLYNNHR